MLLGEGAGVGPQQVKKRMRKKIPLAERHSLERPMAANQVWRKL